MSFRILIWSSDGSLTGQCSLVDTQFFRPADWIIAGSTVPISALPQALVACLPWVYAVYYVIHIHLPLCKSHTYTFWWRVGTSRFALLTSVDTSGLCTSCLCSMHVNHIHLPLYVNISRARVRTHARTHTHTHTHTRCYKLASCLSMM